jgi:hypothetical protein
MPAVVETMVYNRRELPWHGLGTPVDGLVTAREAITAAELDWTVSRQPIFTEDGEQVPGYARIRRDSDDASFAVVGGTGPPVVWRSHFPNTGREQHRMSNEQLREAAFAADAVKAGYDTGVTVGTKNERERVARELRALVATAPQDDAGVWLGCKLVAFARDLMDDARGLEDFAATQNLAVAAAGDADLRGHAAQVAH